MLILVLGTLYFVLSTSVHAQTFDAQKAFQDYQYQQTVYLQTQADYEDAKTFYQKNPTLQLREDARKKTLTFLKARDQLLATYLTAIRIQLTETHGLTANEKGGLFGKIDPEVAWYQNHVGNYQDGDELATLFSKSDESKNRYTLTTRFIVYDTLFNISFSQEIGIRQDHQAIYADLKSFINDQVAAGKLKIDPFNRWLNDTDAVLIVLTQNDDLARKKILPLYTQAGTQNRAYNSAVQVLTTSLTPLAQLNNYLSELLASIESQM